MNITMVKVKGIEYAVPTEILNTALVTFDQQYGCTRRAGITGSIWDKTITVPTLARCIAHSLMPATREDPFSEERLTRVILSLKGRNKRKKQNRSSSSGSSMPLFPEES